MPSSSSPHFFSENRSESLEKKLKLNLEGLRENLSHYVSSVETANEASLNKKEIKAKLEAEFKLLTALCQILMRSELDVEKKNSFAQSLINLIGEIKRNLIPSPTHQENYFQERYKTIVSQFSDFRASTQTLQNDLIASHPPLFSLFEKVLMALASVTLIGLIVVAVQYTKRKSEVEKLQQSLKECVARPATEMSSSVHFTGSLASSNSAISSTVSSQPPLRSESPVNDSGQAQGGSDDDSCLEEADDDFLAIDEGTVDPRLTDEEEQVPSYLQTLIAHGLVDVDRRMDWYPPRDDLEHFNP